MINNIEGENIPNMSFKEKLTFIALSDKSKRPNLKLTPVLKRYYIKLPKKNISRHDTELQKSARNQEGNKKMWI